jgi:hypothetical protein
MGSFVRGEVHLATMVRTQDDVRPNGCYGRGRAANATGLSAEDNPVAGQL